MPSSHASINKNPINLTFYQTGLISLPYFEALFIIIDINRK